MVAALIVFLVVGATLGYNFARITFHKETVTIPYTETITVTTTVTEIKTVNQNETISVSESKYGPVTITDALGRIISFNEKPQRVVVLSPSITEIVFALGLGNYVIGVDSFSNYPPEVLELKDEGKIVDVGGFWNPDFEKIVSLNPDLIIADVGAHSKFKEKFEELGLKVVFVNGGSASSIEDIYSDISVISEIFNVESKANEIIDNIESEINSIKTKLNETSKVKTLVLLGSPTWGYWTAGSGTLLNYVINVAGGYNIASKYFGWIQLSLEDILAEDPEVIIVTLMGSGEDAVQVIDDIENSELAETKAVKEDKIFVFIGEADDILSRPGPRVGEAVKLVAQILHPEIFGYPTRADIVSSQAFGEYPCPCVGALYISVIGDDK